MSKSFSWEGLPQEGATEAATARAGRKHRILARIMSVSSRRPAPPRSDQYATASASRNSMTRLEAWDRCHVFLTSGHATDRFVKTLGKILLILRAGRLHRVDEVGRARL